jgi:hypothetical protein
MGNVPEFTGRDFLKELRSFLGSFNSLSTGCTLVLAFHVGFKVAQVLLQLFPRVR